MGFTFVTVLRSGGIYDPAWVQRLNRQAREHLKPDRIVCISDVPVDCERIEISEPWPGWFAKIVAFRPGLFGPDEIISYVDLDSLILAPIPDLEATITRCLQEKPLWLLDDFYQPKRPASGVMLWCPCSETERIYRDFVARPEIKAGWSNGDGAIIGRYPHGRIQPAFPGVFCSYKAHRLQSFPGAAKVVCFHGKPKFNDLPSTHWTVQAWMGTNDQGVGRRDERKPTDNSPDYDDR